MRYPFDFIMTSTVDLKVKIINVFFLDFDFQGKIIEFYMYNPKTIYILTGYVRVFLLYRKK